MKRETEPGLPLILWICVGKADIVNYTPAAISQLPDTDKECAGDGADLLGALRECVANSREYSLPPGRDDVRRSR